MPHAISTTTYLENNRDYKKILIIEPEPTGVLKNISKKILIPKLSEFQTNQSNYCNNKCKYVLLDINNPSELMCLSQIPELYNFLLTNGYTINDIFSTLMLKADLNLNNAQLLFYIN